MAYKLKVGVTSFVLRMMLRRLLARAAAGRLTERERQLFLTVLSVAVVIDGWVRKAEAALLAEAHQLCGQPFERAPLDRLLRAFLHGQGIAEQTRAAADASHHCRHFSRVSP